MKKSSSLHAMKFDFNPKEFKVGQSRIDQLPLRMPLRRSSAPQLPRPIIQQKKSELELIKEQNVALRRQNEKLKKDLGIAQQRVFSSGVKTQEKIPSYREQIRNRLTSRTKTSRVMTECETGLFSSKQLSMEKSSITINEIYDNYRLSNRLPSLNDLQDICDRFFKDYCDSYSKLRVLFECINTDKSKRDYQQLKQLIQLYKLPLLYQKSPQALFRELSKSKDNKKKQEETCLELFSPQQTVLKLQGLLQKICRSSQIVPLLRGNQAVQKFIYKIQNGRR